MATRLYPVPADVFQDLGGAPPTPDDACAARGGALEGLPPVLSMQQVADFLGVSRSMLYTVIGRDPSFRSFCVGSRRLIQRDDFAEWLDSLRDAEWAA